MPRDLSFSFAVGARKMLPSVIGFRNLSRRCARSICWNSVFSHIVGDIDSELTPHQNQVLDHFLNEYSDELTHIAAWIADEENSSTHISDDSIRGLRQTFQDHSSANSQAIIDICQNMLSCLLILRQDC